MKPSAPGRLNPDRAKRGVPIIALMEGSMFILFAAAIYFGWLWNIRGASEERQLLASIQTREDAIRREALKRRAMKKLERTEPSAAQNTAPAPSVSTDPGTNNTVATT